MKLSVEFPSIAFREGPDAVVRMAQAIEEIGYDEIAVFDHVVMGWPTDAREAPRYPTRMPVLEPLVLLGFAAAVTSRIGLSTEVLVLPQRQAVLVAKQVSTIDTLSGGRMRLGVGVGWQECEFDALGLGWQDRGRRMDEAIDVLRSCWADEQIDYVGDHHRLDAIAMDPKPPQGGRLPIWVGGDAPVAHRRAGRLGDGWMGTTGVPDDVIRAGVATIRQTAESCGRDPDAIGLQLMLALPPTDDAGKSFYGDSDAVLRRAEVVRSMGFHWAAVNATAIYQSGARSVDAMIERLAALHGPLRDATS